MDERLNNNWQDTNHDIEDQKKFWSLFKENLEKLDIKEKLHGKINAKFSAKYLRKNKNWLK